MSFNDALCGVRKALLLFICCWLWVCSIHAQARFASAKWIGPGVEADSNTVPYFQKAFLANQKIRSATLFITAHGLYEASINSKRVGDAYLTPGWTSYGTRLQYQQYDVTKLLQQADNVVDVTLASGWWRGGLYWERTRNMYGKDISMLAELVIKYANGKTDTVVSDGTWKWSSGNIVQSDIYDGETIDYRKDHRDWKSVTVESFDGSNLIPMEHEPVRTQEKFMPVELFTTPKGERVIDFGQNLVGWVVITAHGHPGDTIRIEHAEILDKAGNFYTENLRTAKATDTYILKSGEETLQPHFTWHGFRYAKVTGWKGDLKAVDFKAVSIYSDLEKTGSFACSDSMINQLQHNIEWGMNGNFVDIPTDCPQRDERLGWTGDAQVFSRTAAFNRHIKTFFTHWMRDLAAEQGADGKVPFVVPNILGKGAGGASGWGDAATIIPWNLWLAYGDRALLAEQYPVMKKWVGYMRGRSRDDLWNTGFHFGDWLFYSEPDDRGGYSAVSDRYLIAQCFYAHSVQLVINAARVLGKREDVAEYSALLPKIKEAFLREYVSPNGRLSSNTQTAYVLALQFDMLPDSLRAQAAKRLVSNIHEYEDHLTTGFLGTPYLCHVLSRFGYDSVAYTLLLQKTYPSWLYPITRGATTIWERWDGIQPDSTIDKASMSSFNHYAYGAIGDWLYRVVAGIDTDDSLAGYQHIIIRPHPGGGLTWVKAGLTTKYGKINVHWKYLHKQFSMEVDIPAGTTATIQAPDNDLRHYTTYEVGPGKHHYGAEPGITRINFTDHPDWDFAVPLKKQLRVEPCEWTTPPQLFVVSDIEGEFAAFRDLLINNGVMDAQYHWTFGKGHLVICGDLFDRGKQVTEYLWLLYALEEKAKAKGGYVHVILGNHDIMNLSGDWRYVQPRYFEEAKALGNDYREWYSVHTELGRWLRTKNIIEKIGDHLFLHAGISPAVLRMALTVEQLNAQARPLYDQSPKDHLLFDGTTSPFWYRGYFIAPFATVAQVDSTLALYGCKRVVVGHTITDTTIATRYGGKVIGIDVDQHEGRHEGLLIEGSKYFVVDGEGRKRAL
jgi:alpha-L-rhamnosidase